MHYLYIIYSQSLDRFYIGETAEFKKRLQEHISHRYKKGYTKAAEDWAIVLKLKVEEKEKAVFLDRYIKKMKNRSFIQKVVTSPEILEEIWKNR